MREGGQMLAQVLQYLSGKLVAGMTTGQVGRMAAAELQKLGGRPAFLGYQGFREVICVSVNEELVHGIPGARVLADGDLVGLDFGVLHRGLITDGAVTIGIGQISSESKRLLVATSEALAAGIAQVKAGARVGDISRAIEARLRRDRLGVVEDLIGHGVGHALHEEPGIPNYYAGDGPILESGMTIAIEPMATLGSKAVKMGRDGWTISAADGSLTAQFEHTVLVTDDGAEILTKVP
jgi:methionyl aminopeptidase